ncbi:MAG: SDR family oxidoreductase [Verrucomicrobiaceae bacterium]|nr:SDR family oxidoreductase [Verrucomicrobiaceae bacterium]
MITLADKIALVTGAGSGIGAAIAECFAEAGALVFASDRDENAAQQTAARIREAGHRAESLVLDVSDESSCLAAVRTVIEKCGRCDVLVNNAGVGHVGTILTTKTEDLERLWKINVVGIYHLSRAVLPGMIERGIGSIVNIASIAGLMGMEARFAYTTTKHAVVGMTRAMAMDHGTTGVRINCICPGRVRTPFVDAMLRQYENPDDYLRQMEAPHAMKRMAAPSEIASAALYLASEAASFVTGSAMIVDGGLSAGK